MSSIPKILIVDDTPEYIDILMELLRGDYKLVPALSGPAALKQVESANKPDLILLDIMMPKMDGYEVCKRLKANSETRSIPIIFLTSKSEESDEKKGFEMGAVDYITKPIRPTIVRSRVQTHLALKKANQELKKKNKELEESIATQNRFFSIIAHDLRSPTAGFISSIELLQHSGGEPKALDQVLGLIRQSGEKLFRLLENLLSWSSVKTGRMLLKPELIPLKSAIKENIDLFLLSAQIKDIVITENIDEDVKINADVNMFQTVIRNLLSNAIKYSDAGGNITFSAEIQGENLNISIKDTGVGISSENITKLFCLDVKCTTTGTNNEKGSGLGLILCKELVEKNNGTLSVSSIPGKGSTFIISLPYA